MGCVYLATNLVNQKRYVGKTLRSLEYRKRQHLKESTGRRAYSFQRAIRKHGPQNFIWEELFVSDDENLLFEKEIEFIRSYRTQDPLLGYNLTKGGEGNSKPTSPETKEKLRQALLGREITPEARKLLSEALRGNTNGLGAEFTEERREKISSALRGKPKSAEHAQKCREASLGYHPSPETLAKRSASLKEAWARRKALKEMTLDA